MSRYALEVPATTANLGPGYDAFGLALGMHNTIYAELAEDWSVEIQGEGADYFRADSTNAVARAMRRVFEQAGVPGRAAAISCTNAIPAGRGLGSSAAAIVGGALLGNALLENPLAEKALLSLCVEIEGHPDNVAAAFFGGFTISALDGADSQVFSVPVGCGLAVVACVAQESLRTAQARKLLPDSVAHADAAFNAGRAGMLAAGLVGGRRDLVAAGLIDRIHEPYRARSIHGFAGVRDALVQAGADGAVLSGAGPTIVGIVCADDDEAAFARAAQIADSSAAAVESYRGHHAGIALRIQRERPVVKRV